jgi:hypothetical protein
MGSYKENPVLDILGVIGMVVLDEWLLRRWLSPLVSAFTSGAVVAIGFMPFYFRSRRRPVKRFLLLILLTALFMSAIGLFMK